MKQVCSQETYPYGTTWCHLTFDDEWYSTICPHERVGKTDEEREAINALIDTFWNDCQESSFPYNVSKCWRRVLRHEQWPYRPEYIEQCEDVMIRIGVEPVHREDTMRAWARYLNDPLRVGLMVEQFIGQGSQ